MSILVYYSLCKCSTPTFGIMILYALQKPAIYTITYFHGFILALKLILLCSFYWNHFIYYKFVCSIRVTLFLIKPDLKKYFALPDITGTYVCCLHGKMRLVIRNLKSHQIPWENIWPSGRHTRKLWLSRFECW